MFPVAATVPCTISGDAPLTLRSPVMFSEPERVKVPRAMMVVGTPAVRSVMTSLPSAVAMDRPVTPSVGPVTVLVPLPVQPKLFAAGVRPMTVDVSVMT